MTRLSSENEILTEDQCYAHTENILDKQNLSYPFLADCQVPVSSPDTHTHTHKQTHKHRHKHTHMHTQACTRTQTRTRTHTPFWMSRRLFQCSYFPPFPHSVWVRRAVPFLIAAVKCTVNYPDTTLKPAIFWSVQLCTLFALNGRHVCYVVSSLVECQIGQTAESLWWQHSFDSKDNSHVYKRKG